MSFKRAVTLKQAEQMTAMFLCMFSFLNAKALLDVPETC